MKRYWEVMAILLTIGVIGASPCFGHEGGHKEAVSSAKGGMQGRFLDFSLPNLDGAPVSLGQLVGKKPVLLVFWAEWCPICREKVPAVNRIHREGTVAVVAVNTRESPKKVMAAVRSLDIRYPVLFDPDGSVARKYKIPGIPVYIVIDTTGRIVYESSAFPEGIEKVDNSLSFRASAHAEKIGCCLGHPCGCSGNPAGRHACRCCVPSHGNRQAGIPGADERCRCAPLSGDGTTLSTRFLPRWEFLAAFNMHHPPVDRFEWRHVISLMAPAGWSTEPSVPPPRSETSC
jgi:peroxiredoxin